MTVVIVCQEQSQTTSQLKDFSRRESCYNNGSKIESEEATYENSPDSPTTIRKNSTISEGKSASFHNEQPVNDYEIQLKKDKAYQALIGWFIFETAETQQLLESLIKRCYNENGRGFKDTNVLLKAVHQLEDGVPLKSITITDSDLIQHDNKPKTKIDLIPEHSASAKDQPSTEQPVRSSESKTSIKTESPKVASTTSISQKRKAEFTCKVCLDEPVSVTFVPCGHLVACVSCASALFECPVCRASIRGTIKTFF